ncbi:MAG TPA: SurA N-terminal domain-containing protein [Smithellaceae bacterium]|nr:SurA N-terminal domain-containing protein [Smithellaceae bacterium]
MLRFLRRNARSWIMYIILGVIIFVFVLYFGSNKTSRTAEAIAVIDKKIISEGDFHQEYERLMDITRLRYGANLNPEILKKMDLKKMAYTSLLNRQVIIAKAADLKIQVSEEELKNMIMASPELQTNGSFDERKYQQMLRYNRTSAEDFENMQKVNLTANKIEALIRDGIKISDKEIYDVYAIQNQKINVNFVQLSAKDIKKNIVPAESDLENYLKNNSNLFRKAEQVKIDYLAFAGADFAKAAVSDSDISDYYSRNKDKFKTKEGKTLKLADARAAIIKELMKMQGMQTAYTEAKKAHDTIYQEDNYEAYAAKNNLKIHKLDFFPLNKVPENFAAVKDLAATLMNLQKNEISKVIKAEDGYYVLRILDKKAAYLPALKDIKADVEKYFIENEKNSLAEKEAQSFLERLRKGDALDKIAKEKGLKINETGLFQPGEIIPKVGMSMEAAEALLQLTPSKPYSDKPFLINNSYVIFKFKEVSSIDMKDFEAKKDLYKKFFISMKREEAMQTWLDGNKAAMEKEGRMKIKKDYKDL